MRVAFPAESRKGLCGTGSANYPRRLLREREQLRCVSRAPMPSRWKPLARRKLRRLPASIDPWRRTPTHHLPARECRGRSIRFARARSEEHTSELQSHLNLVCRLLLEKKKKIHDTIRSTKRTKLIAPRK